MREEDFSDPDIFDKLCEHHTGVSFALVYWPFVVVLGFYMGWW
jgi:hypothetical protein